MSSASASLRDSQRARLYAEFRCGSTSSAQRERLRPSGNRTSIHRYLITIGITGAWDRLFPQRALSRGRLKERAQHPSEVLHYLDRQRTLPPGSQGQHLAFPQVARLFLTEAFTHFVVIQQDHDLRVEGKGANIEIRGADPCDLIVDGDVLRVQETLTVSADA